MQQSIAKKWIIFNSNNIIWNLKVLRMAIKRELTAQHKKITFRKYSVGGVVVSEVEIKQVKFSFFSIKY